MPSVNRSKRSKYVCGETYVNSDKARHMKSAAHKNYISNRLADNTHCGGVMTTAMQDPWDINEYPTVQQLIMTPEQV